ncbi:hypothetical protein SAMN05444401_3963 [Clostridium amylolyticum]|uniref:Uncharacterized protein n=1 Tax=Clostridium amylolyticum TaxID=1121298 RepID=A0A1M6MDZ7_9CLOT|nr:hypothetical protein SAMN05444401_3963 [Clostridium amylolyticum]
MVQALGIFLDCLEEVIERKDKDGKLYYRKKYKRRI